jgi:hypothetical protein
MRFLLFLIVLILFTGCTPPIQEGEIYSKQFHPAHFFYDKGNLFLTKAAYLHDPRACLSIRLRFATAHSKASIFASQKCHGFTPPIMT